MIITTKDGKKYNVAAENMSDEEKATKTNSEKKEEQEEKKSPVLHFFLEAQKGNYFWGCNSCYLRSIYHHTRKSG